MSDKHVTLARANLPVLRFIAECGAQGANLTAVVKATGRDKSNTSKALRGMAEAGLLTTSGYLYFASQAARAALEIIDRTEGGPEAEVAAVSGMVTRRHDQLTYDPNNPRGRPSEAAVADMMESIATHGQLQNLVIRPAPDLPAGVSEMITTGETRWTAIGRLIQDGRLPADFPIECKVKPAEPAAAAKAALVENLIRRALNPIQEARGFRHLIDECGSTSAELARDCRLGNPEDIKSGQRIVQLRLQLLDLPKGEQDRIESGDLTIKDALKALQGLDNLTEADRDRFEKGEIDVAEVIALLDQPKPPAPVEVNPTMILVLVEAADRVQRERIAVKQPNGWLPCGEADPLEFLPAAHLKAVGLMEFDQWAGAWNFRIRENGRAWLIENAMWPDVNGDRLAILSKARATSGLDQAEIDRLADGDAYWTPFLNENRPASPEVSQQIADALKPDSTARSVLVTAADVGDPYRPAQTVNVSRKPTEPLSDVGHRILVEIAHKIAADPVTTRTGLTSARIGQYWTDATVSEVKDHDLIAFDTEGLGLGWCVALTDAGRERLAAGGWNPDAITESDLLGAAMRGGTPLELAERQRAAGLYMTGWLNVAPPAEEAAKPAAPAGDLPDPEQLHLIAPSPEEADQIRAAMTAREMAVQDDAAVEALANAIRQQLAEWREAGAAHRSEHRESLDRLLWQGVHLGGPVQAAAAIAVMRHLDPTPHVGTRFRDAATAEHAPEVPAPATGQAEEEAA